MTGDEVRRSQADAEEEAILLWVQAEEEAALALTQAREQAALAIAQAAEQADLAVAQAEAQAALAVAQAETLAAATVARAEKAAEQRVLEVKEQAARRLVEVERLEHTLLAQAEGRAAQALVDAEANATAALIGSPPAAPPADPRVEPVTVVEAHPQGEPVRRRTVRIPDALLPVSLVLWLAGVLTVDPRGIDDWGLLPVLPVLFFAGLGLLVVSIAWTLTTAPLSPVRLGLHLMALVVVLHGTMPLVFPQPVYPWVYKHIGVVAYINLHGSLDPSVDIYQNWPGFFALAAWFTRIAGVGSPVAYAEWAPVYFNVLTCLVLGFALRSLRLDPRVMWLALFVFVGGNWVGQDYFAPQALAFVLSVAVFGIILGWFRDHRPPVLSRRMGLPRVSRVARRLIGAPPTDTSLQTAPVRPPSVGVALVALFAVFAVVVFTHQLSPYLVLSGLTLLTLAGRVRPRWVILGLGAITVAYVVPRLPFLASRHQVLDSLGPEDLIRALRHPFDNVHSKGDGDVRPMLGRRVTALAAPALILGLWAVGVVGVVRRLRAGRPTLVLGVLAASPAVLAAGQNYGGEALFRIYLFSLPWTAVLVASALAPRDGRWRPATGAVAGTAMAVVISLFLSASYGSAELTQVRPGEVAASQFFADHAPAGSALALFAPTFPERVSARYDLMVIPGGQPLTLTADPAYRHRMLGAADVPAVSDFYRRYMDANGRGVYLALTTGQAVWSQVIGLAPKGAMEGLEAALARSDEWQVFFRAPHATIYRLLPVAG